MQSGSAKDARNRSSSSGIKSLSAAGRQGSPYKAASGTTKKAAGGGSDAPNGQTHRQRLEDSVIETSQLMEELSRQKKRLEAKLSGNQARQGASDASDPCAPSSLEPWLTDGSSDPVAGATDVATGMSAQMTDLTDGMSEGLRQKVQAAIADLTTLGRFMDDPSVPEATAAAPKGALPRASVRVQDKAGGSRATPTQREIQLENKCRQMEEKMAMSRSIMRKLYHSNVELEKEVKVLSTSQKSILDDDPQDSRVSQLLASASDPRESVSEIAAANGISPGSPIVSLLKERNETIKQLKMALETSRRRAAALEQRLAAGGQKQPIPGGRASGGRAAKNNTDSLKDMLAQSALHFKQYQQIRNNYNSLLERRTQALSKAPGASKEAKLVVNELSSRLKKEIEEREAEAALYNAKLYESEKQQGDWYVEKRLLQKRIEDLDRELKERDEVDSEIESCVGSLFERISGLEQDNQQLRQQLSGMGLLADASDNSPGN